MQHLVSYDKHFILLTKSLSILLPFSILSCNNNATAPQKKSTVILSKNNSLNNENEFALINNIPLPFGYVRADNDTTSFAFWLANLPLKKDKTVYLYDSTPKLNQKAQFAVLDISVGTKNLQQCADAVMRLRAEYLFSQKRFNEISFTDNENTHYNFFEPYSKVHFMQYLQKVFGMCGTASLAKQLYKKNKLKDVIAGDVFIRGGFPGHAVIVVDIAININGNKIFLLAQSFMPAQNIHVLNNPKNENLSPWYEATEFDFLQTPEYIFRTTELMQWNKN